MSLSLSIENQFGTPLSFVFVSVFVSVSVFLCLCLVLLVFGKPEGRAPPRRPHSFYQLYAL